MKQFPWREYFWIVLLLSLAVGLAVELHRASQLSVFRDQSLRAEKTARELAGKIGVATNSQPQFGNDPQYGGSYFNPSWFVGFDRIYFVANDGSQRTVRSVGVDHVWRTDEKYVFPISITGMMDLDILLVIVPTVGLLVWVIVYFSSKFPAAAQKREFSLQMFRLVAPVHILFMTAMCIFGYRGLSFGSDCDCKPYFGAFMLTTLAIFIPRYFYLCGLTDEEHAHLLQETQWRLISWEKLKPYLRFQLRDIFWLMLAIALASAIFAEHRRARDLMPFRGSAEWWSNATEELQKEYNKLPMAQ